MTARPLARLRPWLRDRRVHLAAYGFYLAVAGIVTWPVLTVFSSHFLGHPFGDSYEYARFIWGFVHALQTGQPLFFEPLLAYPDGLPSALLWSIPLQSFPAWLFALALPLPAAFNLSALLRLALNGWAMYFLVWRLTGRRVPALAAGVIFLAYPTFQGQLAAGHTGLLALWPVPLYVYHLYGLAGWIPGAVPGASGARHLPGAALFFALSTLGSNQLLIFMLLPLTAAFGLALAARRDWRALRRVTAAAALGAALALVFILPGLVEVLNAPPWLRERGDVYYSADLLGVVSPSFQHPVFGQLDYPHTVLGIEPFEKTAYVGILAGVLALAGARRPGARWWLALAAAAWILSLGPLLKVLETPVTLVIDGHPTYIPLPWALAQQFPAVNIVRVPARFNFTVALAVAVLAGYGLASWPRRWSLSAGGWLGRLARPLALLAAAACILWEYQLFWAGMPVIPASIPAPVAALSARGDVRAVFDLPWQHLLAAKDGLYLQTAHRRPLIAGHVTRRTPVSPARLSVLQATLDPALLDAAGVDVLILHKTWDEGQLEPFVRERLGSPFYEDERIAVFNAPPAGGAPGFAAVLNPAAAVTDRADFYFYAPESGLLAVRAALAGEGQTAALYLDGQLAARWTAAGETPVTLDLEIAGPGYYTLTLAVEPACPAIPDGALRCRALDVSGLALAWQGSSEQRRSSAAQDGVPVHIIGDAGLE